MHGHDTSLTILLLLGAAHGVNPAMGWLFAVSLGLQEQRRVAVWRAFGPLALGHGLAIAGALAIGVVLPLGVLKWLVAAALVGMGVRQLLRHRHPRWGGMRMGARDLAIWSFLMASAHGAGLMALPFLLGPPAGTSAHAPHALGAVPTHSTGILTAGIGGADAAALLGTAVHTAGYLVVAALVAVIVYEKVGLRILRRGWINLDLIWAAALIATGLLTPLW